MVKKAASKTAAKSEVTMLPMRVAHRIESLLHTMRLIERHEEQLCVLMTEIRNTGEMSGAIRKELHDLLEELPADAYRLDMEAVSMALLASGGAMEQQKDGVGKRPAVKKTVRGTAPAVARKR